MMVERASPTKGLRLLPEEKIAARFPHKTFRRQQHMPPLHDGRGHEYAEAFGIPSRGPCLVDGPYDGLDCTKR